MDIGQRKRFFGNKNKILYVHITSKCSEMYAMIQGKALKLIRTVY